LLRLLSTGPAQVIGSLSASGISIAALAMMLEEIVGRPVVDESGLEGYYDVEVSGPHGTIDGFAAALEREMHLTLTRARRGIEMVAVK
jgi:uncharacterized protein (TIGR03435 family)